MVSPLSVAQTISRARVSRSTFYSFFEDKCDCVIAGHQEAIERGAEH
jgi:hypothetical protein